MVRQNHLIDPKIRWRTGVQLHKDGFHALIKADIRAATIHISISGDGDGDGDRRAFLYLLRNSFAAIHATISGTKPQEVVPIPNYPDAPPIPYQFLLELEEDGIEKQRFVGVRKAFDVQWLLNGVSTIATRQATSGNTYNVHGDLIIGDKAGGDKITMDSITGSSVEIDRR